MVLFTPNINASLAAGETERWVVQTTTKVAARVTLSANGQPYDVDVATAENEPRPGDFDTGNYDTSLPTGAITISDTDDHTIGVDAVDNSIYVEVTNNSGSQMTVSGSIYLLSSDAASSVEQFTTQRVGERSNAWLDGKGLENATEVRTESLVDDSSGTSYDVDSLAGGGGGSATSVSDDGAEVVADTSDINFDQNLDVTDDGDDTVTVDGTGDPADVSDDGGTVTTAASDINFGTDLTASDDGDGTATVDLTLDDSEVDLGTQTLTTGSTPAFDGTIAALSADEAAKIDSIRVYPDPTGQLASDYAYNIDWGRAYDDSDGEVDLNLTVNWDTDPGTNLTVRVVGVVR